VRGLIARFMRRAVQVTFNIDIPISVAHLFNGWATRLGVQFKKNLHLWEQQYYIGHCGQAGMIWCLIIL
jgi:hypothetical protein